MQHMRFLVLGWMIMSVALAATAWGQELPDPFDLSGGKDITDGKLVLDLSTVWSAESVKPGDTVHLAVVFDIKEGWHINAPGAPKSMIPTTLEVDKEAPKWLGVSKKFPTESRKVKIPDIGVVPVYEGKVVAHLTMRVGKDAPLGEAKFKIQVGWQACKDKGVCLFPVTVEREVLLKVASTVPASRGGDEATRALFKGLDTAPPASERLVFDLFGLSFGIDTGNLVLIWLVAALGGFLLNFTPCVLPLIPIKIIGLSQAASNRGKCLLLGVMMFLGVAAFWLGLGVAIGSATGFNSTNQLFQMPWFTVGVGVVIALMALGMCGLFAIRLPQAVYMVNPSHDTLPGSFLFGVMTAVLSTPCTAPFMGAAAAWAATQSSAVTLSTFTAIGVGMALPYLVLSAFPHFVDKMPRTGPASELIKQVMGLLMLAAASYFLGTGVAGMVVTPPDPPTLLYWWVVSAFVVAAGAWLTWKTVKITKSTLRRVAFGTLGVAMIAAAIFISVRFTDKGPIRWVYFTPERLAAAQKENKVVVLEFTAQWCLNCQALEQSVLRSQRIVELLNGEKVAPIKVDLTGNNEAGNARLLESGRRTIPLLVVYDPSGKEVFKSDAYTVQQVVDAIGQASGGGGLSSK